MAMKLVLFDIDGTLLSCGPQVRPLFASALVEVFGTAGEVDAFDFTGRTDPGIVLDLITGAGLPEALVRERLPRMRSLYTERLDRQLDRREMVLLPGVVEILERLIRREDVVTALLTGNWEPGAKAKLSRFDLGRYFAFGAFGCDGVDRSELPPVALDRAERATGRRFRPEDVLIVGDSVHDVSCARAHGISCLAVGTGRTPGDVLQAAGADWVIGDLRQAALAVPWLG
jgi:phosphoglycolate phosphatase-like HAD superfamily hydrolase